MVIYRYIIYYIVNVFFYLKSSLKIQSNVLYIVLFSNRKLYYKIMEKIKYIYIAELSLFSEQTFLSWVIRLHDVCSCCWYGMARFPGQYMNYSSVVGMVWQGFQVSTLCLLLYWAWFGKAYRLIHDVYSCSGFSLARFPGQYMSSSPLVGMVWQSVKVST